MEGLNLLPWREQKKEEQKKQFLFVLVGTAILAVLVIVLVHMLIGAKIDRQRSINTRLQNEANQLDVQIAKINTLKNEKNEMMKRLDLIYKLQASRPLIVNAFDTLARIIPRGLYLRSMKREGDIITLEGSALSNTQVSQLMLNAEATPWFANANLLQIKSDPTNKDYPRSFMVNLTLTTDKIKKGLSTS